MTGLYLPDTEALLSRSLRHECWAQAVVPGVTDPVPLEVRTIRIGWDERRAPRVQCNLTCVVPEDQATLDLLDPRTGTRVEVFAGYVRPGGVQDVHMIADLGLRERSVSRPDDLMTMGADSDEALFIDGAAATGVSAAAATIPLTIKGQLNFVLSPDPAVTITHPDRTSTSITDITDRWTAIQDLADQVDGTVYDNGLREWVIERRPVVAATSAVTLKVGANGTILRSDAALSRDDWANSVVVRYRWVNASDVETVIHGTAQVLTGPFAVSTAGTRIFTVDRETPTTQAAANKVAAGILSRQLSRSRSFRLTAVAAYWVRPGHTATVQLPTGGQERHLVSSVEFDPIEGTMDVTTRLPDNVSTIGE